MLKIRPNVGVSPGNCIGMQRKITHLPVLVKFLNQEKIVLFDNDFRFSMAY